MVAYAEEPVELGAAGAVDRAFCGRDDGADGILAGWREQEYGRRFIFIVCARSSPLHCEESARFSARSRSTRATSAARARASAGAEPRARSPSLAC